MISEELAIRLKEYLDFRHLFRNIYVFRLQWERMGHLVLHAEEVVEDLRQQLAHFVEQMDRRSVPDAAGETEV